MRHRNLSPGYEWTTSAIADVLERGTAQDWRELADHIRNDPSGETARAVQHILSGTHFYGTTNLWHDYLERHGKL